MPGIPTRFFKVLLGFLQLLLLSTYFTIDLIELNNTYEVLYMRRIMSIYLMQFKARKGAMKLRDSNSLLHEKLWKTTTFL